MALWNRTQNKHTNIQRSMWFIWFIWFSCSMLFHCTSWTIIILEREAQHTQTKWMSNRSAKLCMFSMLCVYLLLLLVVVRHRHHFPLVRICFSNNIRRCFFRWAAWKLRIDLSFRCWKSKYCMCAMSSRRMHWMLRFALFCLAFKQ